MAEVVAGLLTSAVINIETDKLSSVIAEQAGLVWNFSDDLEDMKGTMESMAAVLKDAEKQSVKDESVRLWLKRLKNAALDICDMMDDYHDTDAQSTAKMSGLLSCLTAAPKMMVLANKMNNMREKLKRINKERRHFSFTGSNAASQDQQPYDERETTSVVNEEHIIGRDDEKKEITNRLSASHRKDGTVIFPIYGLGGMGKSTLAQLVYNDTQFKQYEHRAWVYVSEVFDLNKIGKSIISQLSTDGGQQNLDTLQMIQQRLDKLLPGKKILIVLDDIWQTDVLELDKLKRMLHVEKKGSMVDVIVTTRSGFIAQNICTDEPHNLQPLSDDVCWDIIKRYSGLKDKNSKGELEQIGMEIAKKCGGVALAAQALGYTLRSKDLHGWSEMNNNDIWKASFGADDPQHMKVLTSLTLSYERMPPMLKLCFSYCAIFSKGHDIYEDDLVHQWVALDFIKKPSEGKGYVKQLLGMSFLQHSKLCGNYYERHMTRYTMHDLVHDLAKSVIDDGLIVIDASKKKRSNNTGEHKYCRFALLTNYDGQAKLSNILPKKVRALRFSRCSNLAFREDGSLAFARCLRILDFSQLNQLKCLVAPKLQNERLPNSIAQLSKLHYLNLRGSSMMSALPESIIKLRGLIYLGLSGCYAIVQVPESLGELKSLVHLDMSHCSRITVLPESLGGLESLEYLCISYCHSLTALPKSLGELKKLVHLDLSFCSGITFLPESLGGLKNLVHLDMSSCSQITALPGSLVHLKNLQHLDLSQCWGVEELPESLGGLNQLQHLNLSYCNRITSLPEAIGSLINLQYLNLSYCYSLESLPDRISEITTLKSVLIEECSDELKDQASSNLHDLLTLPIFKVRGDAINVCSNLTLLEDVNVGELRIFSLENVRFLKEASTVQLIDKSKLEYLTLAWTLHSYRHLHDKDVLERLVPPRGLRELHLKGYSSPSCPSWLMGGISYHLPNLSSMILDGLATCSEEMPPLGQLPKLQCLSLGSCYNVTKVDKKLCGGKVAFPRLSKFTLSNMEGLEEWSTTYSVEDGDVEQFMFPTLEYLSVKKCPKLRLKPCQPTFETCMIEMSDQVISSLEEVGKNTGHLASSNPCTRLTISGSDIKDLRVLHHFPALQRLEIRRCANLTRLPESMRHLASLRSLVLDQCDGISALPEWMGDLSSLKYLGIVRNPELKRWCELEENKMKLAHIREKYFEN